MTAKQPIKSLAGHVLATDPDPEKRRLAAAVLGDDSLAPAKPTRSKEDLQRLLTKLEGVEAMTERANEIRKQLASFPEEK